MHCAPTLDQFSLFLMCLVISCSGVVARRHQEVCEDRELVLGELLLVLLPVVLVGPLEVLQGLLNNHLKCEIAKM